MAVEQPVILDNSYQPKEGYVPTSEVAKQIAYAVLVPVYGKRNVDSKLPFTTTLTGDTWIIRGTLTAPVGHVIVGGVPTVMISKTTGKILYMIHSQ